MQIVFYAYSTVDNTRAHKTDISQQHVFIGKVFQDIMSTLHWNEHGTTIYDDLILFA